METTDFDVQGILIKAKAERVFEYISEVNHLPEWTQAFREVGDGWAKMVTPEGELIIELAVQASREHGTIDWTMRFPDGSTSTAYSRVTQNRDGQSCVYSFVLVAPPVPLERLEGALAQQKVTLAEELRSLQAIFE